MSDPAAGKPGRPNALLRWIRRYFGFSRRETSGFVVLFLLMLLWLVLPWLLRPALPHYDPQADQQQLNRWAAELEAQRQPRAFDSRYPRRSYAARTAVPRVALSPFDPNSLTPEGWEARGLPHFVAQRIVHFRDVIGGFKAKEQIRRTYGLPDSVYARLAPYIQLPEQLPARESKFRDYAAGPDRNANKSFASYPPNKFARKPTHLAPFDLNAADTTQFKQIRGIGSRLSARLVAYRERLGGFIREEQVGEIYNLAPDLVDSLRKYTFVNQGFTPAFIDVNNASLAELKEHPYVGLRLGRVIVAFRQQHGPFRQASDLRQIRILDDAAFAKLQPYLRF
ncbi:ComEA family DNA-binding protein [Hymenobacter jejuensis]|uniref:Helix-hairpin-helix domain-containing protein n=1 Tax=Hymenobacter jejuensis TaxID=2502781 RepID=A0A5B8A2U4_9BACT|nr:helix-hairpin-helix domain-containing protein [Hymenobacter jejuensis]QDA60903.1 helix-hairpin-helix domain-containing protein [Hymenobacter jejuensis]